MHHAATVRTLNPNEDLYAVAEDDVGGPTELPPPLHRRAHSSTPTSTLAVHGGTPGVLGQAAGSEGSRVEATRHGPVKRQRAGDA